MSGSYIPEYVYGFTGWDEQYQPTYGLIPWPKHLQPREQPDIELTKKGEAYVAAALAEAGGVFFLTLDRNDRTSVVMTIERLINMLDAMDGDENLEATGDDEPGLGWPVQGPQQLDKNEVHDDREGEAHWTDAGPMYELEQDDCDREQSLGANEMRFGESQEQWALLSWEDECEDVSEDEGGDVCDGPHDAADCGDNEPNLGRLETIIQGAGTYGGISDDETGLLAGNLAFAGEGYSIGNQMLDAAGADRVRVSPGLPTRKWGEIAQKLPDGTDMRTCKAPNDSRVPELRADDFGRLPWA